MDIEVVDNRWREHLKALDGLREGIYLRSYGQRDPIVEYKLLSGDLYGKMLETIKRETTSYMFKVMVRNPEDEAQIEQVEVEDLTKEEDNVNIGGPDNPDAPCACGSGKPYNRCCGR